ncbi:MAG: hypothetical protein IKO35_00620, partial [Elusimicrobiaceae bacterium]|nr:hypothetical protein [Elusimicrobiaceae bacterium]
MNTEELMDKLRNPAKYRKTSSSQSGRVAPAREEGLTPLKKTPKKHKSDLVMWGFVLSLVFLTLLFLAVSKYRAEN